MKLVGSCPLCGGSVVDDGEHISCLMCSEEYEWLRPEPHELLMASPPPARLLPLREVVRIREERLHSAEHASDRRRRAVGSDHVGARRKNAREGLE